jgi:hypothetical protein
MARDLITSDTAIRGIKPGDPRRRLSDGAGLYLLLFVKGGAHGWRPRVRHQSSISGGFRWPTPTESTT